MWPCPVEMSEARMGAAIWTPCQPLTVRTPSCGGTLQKCTWVVGKRAILLEQVVLHISYMVHGCKAGYAMLACKVGTDTISAHLLCPKPLTSSLSAEA